MLHEPAVPRVLVRSFPRPPYLHVQPPRDARLGRRYEIGREDPSGDLLTYLSDLLRYDIGREDQWRTDLTRQVGRVELLLVSMQAQLAAVRETDAADTAFANRQRVFDAANDMSFSVANAANDMSFVSATSAPRKCGSTVESQVQQVNARVDSLAAELRTGQQR